MANFPLAKHVPLRYSQFERRSAVSNAPQTVDEARVPDTDSAVAAPASPQPRLEARAILGEKGRLVIPAAIRQALDLNPGETVEMYVEGHELRISTHWSRIREVQERARQFVKPGHSIVEEFMAERRAEALREFSE
jgi:AbrB family looped-hinge helix DNA binding protein